MVWLRVIVNVVIFGVIYLPIKFWDIGFVIYEIVKAPEEKKRQQAADAERKAEEVARLRRHRGEQQWCRNQMVVLGEQSIGFFESIPEHLSLAERHLDQAEVDFADGVFAPFWDSIEKAANALGRFNEGVRHINDNSSRYIELIKNYEDTPPEFPLARQSTAKLDVGTGTAERMKAIVRNAQGNFQFAMIYEQRKTNQILVAGFTNLAQALDQMAWIIAASIDDLTSSVDVMTSTLNESMRAIHSRMGDIAEMTIHHHEELMEGTSEGAAREKKALEMLDNIQRRRRPSL
jgi:methyl-accepting chemotaxis protein